MPTELSHLDVIEKILTKRLQSRAVQPNFEDGLQQGLIRAWQDQETNLDRRKNGEPDKYSEAHVINRAETWARKFFQEPHQSLGNSGKVKQTLRRDRESFIGLDHTEVFEQGTWLGSRGQATFETELVRRLDVEELMAGLPDQIRQVLFLTYWLQYNQDEIGAIIAPDRTTTASRRTATAQLLKRGLQLLALEIGRLDYEHSLA